MPLLISTPPRAALLAGLYSALSTGAFYGFSIYSPALKQQLNLTQAQLVNINTVPYAFGVASTLWGAVTQRVGLRAALLIGGVMLGGSQMLVYLLATKAIVPPAMLPLPTALVVATVITFFGLQLVSSAAFTAPVQHFPQYRGLAASIVKAFVGLGGAVTTQFFVFVWGSPTANATAFNALLLWAALSIGVNLFAALLMPSAADPSAHKEPIRMLNALFFTIAFLGVFATVVSLVPPSTSFHSPLVISLLILAITPIAIILGTCYASEEETRSITHPRSPAPAIKRSKSSFESPVAYDLLAMIRTAEAWLLVFCGAVILGSGNVLATNMAQILESSGGAATLLPTLVTLFSTGNLLGRLLCNVPSDAMVRRGWPRPLFVGAIAALAAAAHLALLAAALVGTANRGTNVFTSWLEHNAVERTIRIQSALLQTGALAGGLAFGAMWPHFVVLASELFGSKHLATNYMFFDGLCGAVGTMLLANALPSAVYTHAAGAGRRDCHGPMCFGPTHGIIAALCVAAIGASALIGCRSQTLYRQIADEIALEARAAEKANAAEML